MSRNKQKAMIKQLIVVAMFLLIQNAAEAIQYAQIILDFTIPAQNILQNEEKLRYMEHALDRLEKTKISFE